MYKNTQKYNTDDRKNTMHGQLIGISTSSPSYWQIHKVIPHVALLHLHFQCNILTLSCQYTYSSVDLVYYNTITIMDHLLDKKQFFSDQLTFSALKYWDRKANRKLTTDGNYERNRLVGV